MFRLFKKHREKVKKYLLVFFLSIVSIGMVITLAPIPGGNTTQGQLSVLATVAGDKITTEDLQKSIDSRLRNSPLGYDARIIPAIAGTVLDDMVLRNALARQAHKMGLEVSNQELRSTLQSIPWLYSNGTFIGMDHYASVVQQQTGLAPQDFEGQLRESILLNKLRSVVSDGVVVTSEEVHEEFLRRNAKARIRYVVFDPSQFLKSVQITPDALQAFFDKTPERYKAPEQRQVRYVIITPDQVRSQVKLTDNELKDDYTQHLADYRIPDRVQVAQILFKTTGKTPAEVSSVENTARDVLAKIKAGADFGALAKKYSEDASASNGGLIGWITHGQTVKEFEDAAFSLQPGQVSGLIRTSYGIHIIKVLDKQSAHLETFAEVKDSIRAAVEKRKVDDAQQSLAQELENRIKEHPEQFDSLAQQAGLEVKQSPLFKYNQTIPDFGSSESFQNLAFQLRLNETGQPIAIPMGVAVIQVTKIVPAHQPTLDEVRAMVEEDYRAAQSKVVAAQKAREFADQAKNGDFGKTAGKDGYTVKESKDFTRQDDVEGLGNGSSLPAAFALKPGEASDVVSLSGNDVVFQVISHTPANEADFAAQRDPIREQLLDQKRNLTFEIYRQNLKQQLMRSGDLKLNAQALKTFLASYATQQ